MNMQTLDLSCFFGKIVLGDDGSQNIIVYEPTLNTLNLKEEKKYWLCYWLKIKRGRYY